MLVALGTSSATWGADVSLHAQHDLLQNGSNILTSRLHSGEYGRDRVISTNQEPCCRPFAGFTHEQSHMLPMTIDRFREKMNCNLSLPYYSMACQMNEFCHDNFDQNLNAHSDYEPIEYVPRKEVDREF